MANPYIINEPIVYDPNFELGQPAASDPIVAAGIRWWGNGGHSVGDAPTATPLDRNFRVSTTALNNVLGVPYGEPREQAGMAGLVHRVNEAQAGSLWVLVFWGRGELPTGGIADLKVNDELASSLDWVVSVEHFLGSASQAACTSLTTALASLGFVEAYPGYAYSVLRIDRANANVPSSATFTATISGRKVLDYRTATMVSSANPALQLYDILTHTEDWLAIPTSRFDTGAGSTWRTVADHCDTVMADGTKRYSFSGLIRDRDPLRAIETIRQHGFIDLHFVRSKYMLADRSCPVAGPRAIEIGAGDWQRPPKFRRIPARKVPNHVEIKYTRPDTWQAASVPVEDPAGVSAAEMRRPEITLVGCISRSAAYRWGVKYFNLLRLERFSWQGTVREAAVADLVPGQLITMSTPGGVTSTPVRVEGMTDAGNGWVQVELAEYDDGTDSTDVATEDDPVVTDGGYTGGAPSPPSSCTLELVEVGPWEVQSLVTDPDELTSGNGWAADDDPAPTVAYDAGNDWTELTPTVGSGGAEANDWRFPIASGDGLAASVAYLLVALQIGVDSGTDDTAWIDLEYRTSADGVTWTKRFTRRVTPTRGATLRPAVYQIPVTTAAYQDVGLVLSAGVNRWKVRRFHVVTRALRPAQNLYSYDLVERWTWVEAGDAEDTTLAYQARKLYPSGLPALALAECPQGETSLEYSILPGAGSLAGRQGGGMGGSLVSTVAAWMFVLGLGGALTPFPAPTTTVVDEVVPDMPDAAQAYIARYGSWATRSLVPDPSFSPHLWTEVNCTFDLQADESAVLDPTTTSPATVTSPEFDFSAYPATPSTMVLVGLVAFETESGTWSETPVVEVEYWAGTGSADTERWSAVITPTKPRSVTGNNHLLAAAIPVNAGSDTHGLKLRVTGDTAGTYHVRVRSLYLVPVASLGGASLVFRLLLTEAAGAPTTVSHYRIESVNAAGLTTILGTIPQGQESTELLLVSGSAPHGGGIQTAIGQLQRFELVAVSPSGVTRRQDFDGGLSYEDVGGIVDGSVSEQLGDHSLADWDDASRAAGSLPIVGAGGIVKEYQTPTEIGLAETDTAESFASLDVGDVGGGDYLETAADGSTTQHGDAEHALARFRLTRYLAKTSDHNVAASETGATFTNRGAGGTVVFTLPAGAAGLCYLFRAIADYTLRVVADTADTLVTRGDAAADSVEFSTASDIVGGCVLVVHDGTSWLATNLSDNVMTVNT